MARTVIATELPKDQNSVPIQVLVGSENRVNLTATVASTAATALPTGTVGMVIVRNVDWVSLNFGTGGVVAANTATSILVPPGEGAYPVPSTATHFALIRVGSADVLCQLESLKQADG
jgi:hypothetical protein